MRVERFGHAGIEVGDLEAAEAFYTDVLGFEVKARFPEDGEVLLGFGGGDHLLLHGAAPAGGVAPGQARRGLHHVAFRLAEGHRELPVVCRRLEELDVDFRVADHGGDAAVYLEDPDGNLIELCTAPGQTPRFESVTARLAAARRFLYTNARPVDRAIFEHVHAGGPADRVVAALQAHRNPDGGFGHALEPDVRCPGSQPIHTLTALELLREAGIRAPAVADDCCAFFSAVATPEAALPALLPGALDHPAAAHWQGDFAFQPSLSWTFGVVAQLTWHGARHEWLEQARSACLQAIEKDLTDEAHHLLYLVRFAGDVLAGDRRDRLLAGCRAGFADSALFVPETPVLRYGLTPLHYAPAPDAAARACFDDALIDAHLDDLLDSQQGDGGWPVRFEPPGGAAVLEWRGRWTLEALAVLDAYGRLSTSSSSAASAP